MENQIILGLILVIGVLAVAAIVKRRGRKGCCGSAGDYKPRKKKLKKVIATRIFTVEGMHCEKCAGRVMEAVNDLTGAAAVVDLKKGTVTVSYDQEIPDEVITARIQRLGYTVAGIQ